jgi:ribosomal-protein-alanine N-acetyltransferase
MTIITQTPRIIIREYTPEEEILHIKLLSDPLVTDYLPKRTPDDNRIIFRDTLNDYHQGNKLTRWGIFNKADDEYIGLALLKSIEGEPSLSELGYVIHDKLKGQGIATEVSKALLTYGFIEMGLSEIYAVTSRENTPSKRVLEKAGMVQGNDIMRNGEWLNYFKIKVGDWRKAIED